MPHLQSAASKLYQRVVLRLNITILTHIHVQSLKTVTHWVAGLCTLFLHVVSFQVVLKGLCMNFVIWGEKEILH